MTGGVENIRLHGVVSMMRGGGGSSSSSNNSSGNIIMDYDGRGNELLQIGGGSVSGDNSNNGRNVCGGGGSSRIVVNRDKVDDPICATCNDKIVQRYLLQVNGLHYHTDCLRCCVCAVGLQTESSCFIRDGRIYCKGDYYRTYGSAQCAKCTRWISSTDWVRRARDSQAEQIYHLACFACDACHRQLSTGEEFALVEKKLLCKTHYQETVESGEESCEGEEEHDSSSGAGGENRNSSRGSKSKTKRVRTTFTDEQLQILQANFQIDSNPDGQDLERIAQITGLSKRVTQVWFQNSRARQKKHHVVDRGGALSNSKNNQGVGSIVNQNVVPGVMLLGTPTSSSSQSSSGSSPIHHHHHHHHHQMLHGHQISRVLTRDTGGGRGELSPTQPFQNGRARQKKHHVVDRGGGGALSNSKNNQGVGEFLGSSIVNQNVVPGVMLLGTPTSSSSQSSSGSSPIHHHHHHHHHHQMLHGHQISRVLTRDTGGGGGGRRDLSPTQPVD